MPAFDDPILGMLPVVLLATGLGIMAIGEVVGRLLSALLFATAWLLGGALLIESMWRCLSLGGWARVAENGWQGAALIGQGPMTTVGDPVSLLLAMAVHLSAGALLIASGRAWGGGPRREQTPATSPQLGGALVVVALIEAEALATNWAEVFGLASLGAAAGTLLLLTSRGTFDGLTGAGRLFIVHRLGDMGLLFAAGLLIACFGGLDAGAVLEGLLSTTATRRAGGALAGFPATWVYQGVAMGLLLGLGTRVCLFPFLGLMKHTHGAPATLLGVSHGIAFAGSGLILALKTFVLFPLAPQIAHLGAIVASGSALLLAAAALSTDDGMLSCIRLLYGVAAVCVTTVLDGQASTAVLGTLMFLMAIPVVLLPVGACIEALQGQTSLSAMGGLSKKLRRSDTVFTLSVIALVGLPGFTGFFFFERVVYGALMANRGNVTSALFSAFFVFLFSLGLWRTAHLAFSGDAPRSAAPAVLVEASWRRFALPIVVVATLILVGTVLILPEEVATLALPDYFVVYDAWVWPAVRPLYATMDTVAGPQALMLSASIRPLVMATVAVVAVAGYALSFVLFRRGGFPTARAQLQTPALQKMTSWFDAGASVQTMTDRLLSVPVSQAGRVTNDLLLPFFVDGPLSRLPSLATSLFQSALRLIHSGDVQRTIAIVILVIGATLTWWSAQQ